MTIKVLIPVANGSEEIETISMVDILRRAGAEVIVASVHDSLEVKLSRGVRVVADHKIKSCLDQEFDLVALPGGMPGAEHLRDSADLTHLLKTQMVQGRWIAAICAAPIVVLQHHGLLKGLNATAYPSMISQLETHHAHAAEFDVVVDKNLVTSRGPGTALRFCIKLVELLFDKTRAAHISKALLID